MRVLLATGIYPPTIGGPATYVQQLAGRLRSRGVEVHVLTFAEAGDTGADEEWPVTRVSKSGGPLARWRRYAKQLRMIGESMDVIYAFSTVSVGVPLLLSRVKGPRRVLRLGGDFGWERATDSGAIETLTEWYEKSPWQQRVLRIILGSFDHLVFSTAFQESLYERSYTHLPVHSVIENALPDHDPVLHTKHEPMKLLFMGRFVAFKNLLSLLESMQLLPDVTLTLIGDGPMLPHLKHCIAGLKLEEQVHILPPMSGQEKRTALLSYDALVLPSLTELSPNVALEARALGLPVLLTEETGLSIQLRQGMMLEKLRTPEHIARAVKELSLDYERIAKRASADLPVRPWETVADEHVELFRGLL